MKKFNKVLLIVLLILLTTLLIGSCVLYIVNRELANQLFTNLKGFFDRPIVIAGISTTIGGLLLYLLIKYIVVNTRYGKSMLAKYEEKQKELEQAHKDFIDDANSKINELKSENEHLKSFICDICELSTNQKIKKYGKELVYGKDTDSETKAD